MIGFQVEVIRRRTQYAIHSVTAYDFLWFMRSFNGSTDLPNRVQSKREFS